MTATSIAAIYDAIKHCNGEYCYICFSPSSERKLVTPVNILQVKFSAKYSKTESLNKKPFKVCYICEAMAARTVRFQRMVTLAASVEAMLSWMTDDLRDALVQQQFNTIPHANNTVIGRAIRRGKELDDALKTIVSPQLNSSHVLHVGSDTPAAPANTTGTSPSGTNATGISPRGTRPSGPGAGGTRVCASEPILVEDDPPLPPGVVQASNTSGQLQLQIREPSTGNVVLHPIIIGSDDKMYVPSLKVEIVNNEFLKSVTDEVLFMYANTPIPPPPPPPPPLKPVPRKPIEVQQINSTTMISTYYDFIQKQCEEKIGYKNTSNLNDVDEVLNKKAKLEDEDEQTEESKVKDGWEVIKPARTYAMKKPVMQMHKVMDWEDKIPMDVISFMDATDPNPIERIMQPNKAKSVSPKSPTMGVISDVRTINDNENNDNENVDNDVVLVENIECIDLC